MTRQPSKYSKSKKFEVSSRSWFAPSQMDQTILKWKGKGWELASKEQIARNKYIIEMEYHLTEGEIEDKQRSEQAAGRGCLIVIVIILAIIGFQSLFGGSDETTDTPTEKVPTKVAVISSSIPTLTEIIPTATETEQILATKTNTATAHITPYKNTTTFCSDFF